MEDSILRGRLAIVFAISILSWAVALGVMSYMGGSPIEPRAGRYFLNYHGQLTEVTRAIWMGARVCNAVIGCASVAIVVLLLALFVRKVICSGDDVGKDHSILVAVAAVLCVLLPLLGAVCGRLHR